MLPTHSVSNRNTSPLRTHGIPELAFLISTDEDFSIFRSFSELSSRNLLNMQAELMRLSEELHNFDRIPSHNITYEEQVVEAAKHEAQLSRLNLLMERYRMCLFFAIQRVLLSRARYGIGIAEKGPQDGSTTGRYD
jgi:hypothetical protein